MMITMPSRSIIDDEYKWPNSGDNLPKLEKLLFINKNKMRKVTTDVTWHLV